jgi:hypothetical protein
MFSKMTHALILSGCLIAAGSAQADSRDVIVPVIAGAAVGAVLATVIAQSGHDHSHHQQYQGYAPQYQPQYQPRYRQQYQPVAYVVQPQYEYRRFAPPPSRGHHHGWRDRDSDYERGYQQGRDDRRW